jgi:ribosomal protein S18 acetylase RimI-like enzyme
MISIRKAQQTDCRFIATIILLAESTGFEITSYSSMFDKTNETLLPIFEKIIDNETEGHPLTYKSYLIACVDDIPASAISVYNEGQFGDSTHLMTGALMTGFNRKDIALAFNFLKEHSEINIPKKNNTFQIDCVATLAEYRGLGLLKKLMNEAAKNAAELQVAEMQIQVWKKNQLATRIYEKYGYKICKETVSNTHIANGKILMTKII